MKVHVYGKATAWLSSPRLAPPRRLALLAACVVVSASPLACAVDHSAVPESDPGREATIRSGGAAAASDAAQRGLGASSSPRDTRVDAAEGSRPPASAPDAAGSESAQSFDASDHGGGDASEPEAGSPLPDAGTMAGLDAAFDAGSAPPSESAPALAQGLRQSCIWRGGGTALCWGKAPLGPTTATPSPVSGLENIEMLAPGRRSPTYHSCALRRDGTVQCWGANELGQLGDGTKEDRTTPVTATGLTDVAEVRVGPSHTCARTKDGAVYCWGLNNGAQLGDGTVDDRAEPTRVALLDDAVEIGAGSNHSCARTEAGRVRCWGADRAGELGDGELKGNLVPTEAVGLGSVTALAVGGWHTCALRQQGDVLCWGDNTYDQLGDPDYVPSESDAPRPVPGVSGAIELRAGALHTCARLGDGRVLCWGANYYGNLGGGSEGGTRAQAAAVAGIDDATALGLSFGNGGCAVRAGQAYWCWGENASGQLGDGTMDNRSTPVKIDVAAP